MYLHDYKLIKQTDENGHRDCNIDYEIKRQKVTEEELACMFIRIYPDNKDFDIFRAINEIFRCIKQLPKKTLVHKISTRLEFK